MPPRPNAPDARLGSGLLFLQAALIRVIAPQSAGPRRHPREGGDPRNSPRMIGRLAWIPALVPEASTRRGNDVVRMTMAEELPFKKTMNFAYGVPRELAPGVVRIVANNPNHFTFKGTNTYLLGTGPT